MLLTRHARIQIGQEFSKSGYELQASENTVDLTDVTMCFMFAEDTWEIQGLQVALMTRDSYHVQSRDTDGDFFGGNFGEHLGP